MAKTLKQQKALNNLVADGGSIASAMVKAGYSSRTARTPKKFTGSPNVKYDLENIVKSMEGLRAKILTELSLKDLAKEKAKDLSDILKSLNHDIKLLNGGNTETMSIS